MKSKDITKSNYFLKTFKDFYTIKNKTILTPLNLNKDELHLYDKKLFEDKYIKEAVYKAFINETLVKPKRLNVEYVDLNINTPADLFMYNFTKEYVKAFKKFRIYKKASKDFNSGPKLSSTASYGKRINEVYRKSKKQYLEYRSAFKVFFKNNPKLGEYYLYLANCNIEDNNINIIEPTYLF